MEINQGSIVDAVATIMPGSDLSNKETLTQLLQSVPIFTYGEGTVKL